MYIRLRELREERGLSPKEAAKAAGVTEKTYRRYEEGIGRIRIPCMVNLAEFYQCSIDYLLGRTEIREVLP